MNFGPENVKIQQNSW